MPCGHICCTSCCEEGVVEGRLQCHKCDLFHYPIHNLHVFPIAYIVEDLVKHYQKLSESSDGACQGNSDSDDDEPRFVLKQDPRWATSSTMTSMLVKQDSSMTDFASAFISSKTRLDNYRSALDHCLKEHKTLKEELNVLLELNDMARAILEQERKELDKHKDEGEKLMEKLSSAKELIQKITSVKDAIEKLKESDECLEEAQNWAQKDEDKFPNDELINRTVQIRLIIKKNIRVMVEEMHGEVRRDTDEEETSEDEEDEAEENYIETKLFSFSDIFSDQEEIHSFKGFSESKELKVDHPFFKYLLPEYVRIAKVYAVQDENKVIRSARLSAYKGRIHLHNLEVGAPPDDAYTIKHSDLIDLLDTSSILTFLDFKMNGEDAERVHIRMNDDTIRAKQFVLLCAGTWGGSYADKNLIMVWNQGCQGECVWGGDYNGGSSIIPGLLTGGEYEHPNKLGTVSGWYTDFRGTRFCITTVAKPESNLISAFGMVEKGIEVVVKIAQSFHGRGWKVVTCGLVIEEACLDGSQRRKATEEDDQSETWSDSSSLQHL